MEKVEIYKGLCVCCLIGTVVFLMVVIYLFVRMDIWQVIQYLSGVQERKEICKLKKQMEEIE